MQGSVMCERTNKTGCCFFFFTKLLYIMVMVAINSVQLLCRRTCQTLQVYHRQRQPYTIGTGEGDNSAFQAFLYE